ncbi:MAG: site-2 protease family protein, partial [Coriobacteriales bacterium]|nr:site-2 protease family protein [Coriobacteriales bacterium]
APVFGYAKPVPYNPRYFKNIKVGEVLTGLAGPASNLIMALLGALVAFIVLNFTPLSGDAWGWTRAALYYFVLINLCLMFFNLLPIPPLDGSSVIVPFLPQSALPTWYKIQHYAMPALILLVIVVPMLLPGSFNPIGIYIQATAGNLARLLFGF